MNQQTSPGDHTEPARAPLPRQMPVIARAAGIVALYVIGWLGLDRATQVFEVSPGITVWYPVPALSLALLLIFGLRYAPALLIGPLLSAFWLHPLPIPLAPLYALIIALILALFYGAAAAALRYWVRIDLRLRQLRDVAWFVAVAIIAAPLAGALCAVAGFAAAGLLPWPQYLSGVVSFWAGDAIGILTLTPFLLIHVAPWAGVGARESRAAAPLGRRRRQAILEFLAQGAAIMLIPWAIFRFPVANGYYLLFLCFLPLIWIALRHGLPGAVIGTLALNVEVALATHLMPAFTPLASLQIFMLSLSLAGLCLGAVATERKRSSAHLRRQNEYMEALHDTALSLLNQLELDDLLEAILARAGSLVGAQDGFVYLVDEAAGELVICVGTGVFSNRVGVRLKRGEGLAGYIWQTGAPLAVADYTTWPGSPAHLRTSRFHALAGLPLISGGRTTGVIGLAYRDVERSFSAEALDILGRFAQLASLALENARLYSAAQQELAERKRVEETQRFLAEASAVLVASLDFESTLTTLTQLAVPALADWCMVHLLQPDQSIQRVARTFADPADEALALEMDHDYPPDQRAPQGYVKAIHSGQPVLVSEFSDAVLAELAEDERHLRLLRAIGLRSGMSLPLIARGRILGAITFVRARSGRIYHADDLELARDLAHRAALAVDNARLYRDARRRLAELTTVQNIAWAINSTLRLDELFRTIVTQISAVFGYQMVSIYLREGDGLALQAYVGYDEVMWFIRLDQAVSGRVVRTGEAAFVRDAAEDPDFIMIAPGTRQAIIMPLKSGGEVLGMLLVESAGTPILTDDDFTLLTLLADQISVAVANARLFADLRASEQRYRSLLTQAADSIFVTDPHGRIVDANQQAAALLGYTHDQLLGLHLHDIVAPPDADYAQAALVRLRHAGRAVAALRLRGHDGTLLPVEINAATIDADVVLAIVRDVSERLRLESQLLQAQKLEAIGTLANGIAHDFNNLLAAIIGYADLTLESTPEDDPRHSDLLQIAHAAQRGAGLTRQMLAFSRPAAPERRPLDLAELVHEVFRLLRPTIPSTIAIHAEPAGDCWPVEADSGQIQQVLVNLVVNARDAMPDGGDIRIATANMLLDAEQARRLNTPPGRYVRLSVADSGVGMDEQLSSRIFEPFFTTKTQGKGTGLGLAVTHGIVRGHGGVIDVASRSGHGTTMAIYLPAGGAPASPDAPAGGGALHGRGELILIVDDEPAVRQLGRRILERYGYQTLTAEDGRTAIEVFSAHAAEIAVVVLDLTMPGMDGRATFHVLREISDVPVIFSSGQSAAELAGQLEAPDTTFVAKPYNLADLTQAVAQMAQSSRKPA